MDGVVSLLPQPYYGLVEQVWDELEMHFGLHGIRVTPYPHFSWQIAEAYSTVKLGLALAQIAETAEPLLVKTAGLGIFSGPEPVVFIAVVKDEPLMRFHKQVWDALQDAGQGINPYYSPENWVPHISVAYGDVNAENLGDVMRHLAFQPFAWSFKIDNFLFIEEPEGTVGVAKAKITFGAR